jgi:HSP20 family protein
MAMAEKTEKEGTREVESWRPFGDLEPWPKLFGEWRLPRLMEELSREWPGPRAAGGFLPAIDVSDDDERYTITVELAGAKKDDVHVELHEGVLTIRGEKRSEREERKERRRYTERTYGAFRRSLRLPPDADAERLEAKFTDGVLTLTIPKSEEAKPRTIAIK